jgi:hypothetical protein
VLQSLRSSQHFTPCANSSPERFGFVVEQCVACGAVPQAAFQKPLPWKGPCCEGFGVEPPVKELFWNELLGNELFGNELFEEGFEEGFEEEGFDPKPVGALVGA